MYRYILRRLLLMIPVILGVSFIIFTIMYFIPGDPASMLLSADATQEDIEELRSIIADYVQATHSAKAAAILGDFENNVGKFKKIIPHDYKKMNNSIKKFESTGLSHEEAEIKAFYAVREEA